MLPYDIDIGWQAMLRPMAIPPNVGTMINVYKTARCEAQTGYSLRSTMAASAHQADVLMETLSLGRLVQEMNTVLY